MTDIVTEATISALKRESGILLKMYTDEKLDTLSLQREVNDYRALLDIIVYEIGRGKPEFGVASIQAMCRTELEKYGQLREQAQE